MLIKIHLYCGLFTVFYLLVFGMSSIVLNHKIQLDKSEISDEWSSLVKVNKKFSDTELAESVRDQLDIMGWTPYWRFKRNDTSFKFVISHFGRNYHLDLLLDTGDVQVSEAPMGFLSIINGLHFFNGNVPNAPLLLRSWAAYQWLTLITILISLVVGLWLWLKFNYHTWEGITFGGLFVATLLIMMLI